MTIYFEGWQAKELTCEECGWQGNGDTCKTGNMYRKMFLELYCPSCNEIVDLIDFSSFEGCGKHQEKSADELKEQREYRALCLQSPEQLPDLPDDVFELLWDQEGGDTQIKNGDLVVWSEPVAYEGFDRFERIALILKGKYGSRVRDLVPTDRSQLFLYGDYFPAVHHVLKIRKELFGSSACKEDVL